MLMARNINLSSCPKLIERNMVALVTCRISDTKQACEGGHVSGSKLENALGSLSPTPIFNKLELFGVYSQLVPSKAYTICCSIQKKSQDVSHLSSSFTIHAWKTNIPAQRNQAHLQLNFIDDYTDVVVVFSTSPEENISHDRIMW